MAVKRFWLINTPSGIVDVLQKAQFLIGYPFEFEGPPPTVDSFRIWFPNAPNGTDNKSDRQQIALGIPTVHAAPSPSVSLENYLRRYLDDPLVINATGPEVIAPTGTETDEIEYLRRYLGDPN